jgi:Chaperone for flagella basal body P-ring formation
VTTTLPPLPGSATGSTPAPPRAPRPRRRSPAVLALAVALVAAGGLGGAVLYNATGQRSAVLALAHNVPAGGSITAADLVVAHISLDPSLQPVGAASLENVVGMRATTDLMQGQFLTTSDVTRSSLVQPGQQVLGLPTKDNQLPAVALQPGDKIMIVSTGGSSGSGSGSGGGGGLVLPTVGTQLPATVVTVGAADTDGTTVVDIAVPGSEASPLAVLAATGGFAVVFAPQGGG